MAKSGHVWAVLPFPSCEPGPANFQCYTHRAVLLQDKPRVPPAVETIQETNPKNIWTYPLRSAAKRQALNPLIDARPDFIRSRPGNSPTAKSKGQGTTLAPRLRDLVCFSTAPSLDPLGGQGWYGCDLDADAHHTGQCGATTRNACTDIVAVLCIIILELTERSIDPALPW